MARYEINFYSGSTAESLPTVEGPCVFGGNRVNLKAITFQCIEGGISRGLLAHSFPSTYSWMRQVTSLGSLEFASTKGLEDSVEESICSSVQPRLLLKVPFSGRMRARQGMEPAAT